MVSSLEIEGRKIGQGQPCFIIAEAGVNHNGDVKMASEMIRAAAAAGVDAVKFQTFVPEKLVAPEAPRAEYQIEATHDGGSQLDLLRPLVLPKHAYLQLIAEANAQGLLFLSTPFDPDSADFLDQLGLPAFKVSSGDLTDLPFLEMLARKGKPVLISTGMGTLADVSAALEAVRSHGAPPVGLFHCVSNYPTHPADCNLRAMKTLDGTFGVPVGWSDHTDGIDITLAAVALGANLVEKHFTLDRSLPGPDHRASLEPEELRAMVSGIRRVESALGDGIKEPRASEIPVAAVARKSLFWSESLPARTTIHREHLMALRPGTGLSPARQDVLVGRVLSRAVRAGEMVQESDF
jgi:N-acetylneuraminate synthase